MVRSLLLLLVVMIVGALAGAAPASPGPIPLRPLDGIFDREGWLKEPMRAAMVRKILRAREKGDSRLFVVILDEVPKDGGELARRWGREWGKGGLWGMVLHVPGEGGFPVFHAGLSRSPPWSQEQIEEFDRSLKEAVDKVRRGAASLSGEPEILARGVADLADELGYLSLVMTRIDHRQARARRERTDGGGEKVAEKEEILPFRVLIPGLGLLALGLLFLIFRKSSENGEAGEEKADGGFLFPETKARIRFRAPRSGGGNVLVEFRRSDEER